MGGGGGGGGRRSSRAGATSAPTTLTSLHQLLEQTPEHLLNQLESELVAPGRPYCLTLAGRTTDAFRRRSKSVRVIGTSNGLAWHTCGISWRRNAFPRVTILCSTHNIPSQTDGLSRTRSQRQQAHQNNHCKENTLLPRGRHVFKIVSHLQKHKVLKCIFELKSPAAGFMRKLGESRDERTKAGGVGAQ